MTIYFIQPDECVTPSRYGIWLEQWGVPTRTLHPQQLPATTLNSASTPDEDSHFVGTDGAKDDADLWADASGFILLGGRMSALDDTTYPWLRSLYALVKTAVEREIPVLGICLGHQIIAQALGGQVQVNSSTGAQEGPCEISLTTAGAQDPVIGALQAFGALVLYESHNDVVTELPPGAIELATSSECPVQAFRYGSAIGVQFHPEAAPEDMERWWQLGHPEDCQQSTKFSATVHRSLCEVSDPLTETLGYLLLRGFVEQAGIRLEALLPTARAR